MTPLAQSVWLKLRASLCEAQIGLGARLVGANPPPPPVRLVSALPPPPPPCASFAPNPPLCAPLASNPPRALR